MSLASRDHIKSSQFLRLTSCRSPSGYTPPIDHFYHSWLAWRQGPFSVGCVPIAIMAEDGLQFPHGLQQTARHIQRIPLVSFVSFLSLLHCVCVCIYLHVDMHMRHERLLCHHDLGFGCFGFGFRDMEWQRFSCSHVLRINQSRSTKKRRGSGTGLQKIWEQKRTSLCAHHYNESACPRLLLLCAKARFLKPGPHSTPLSLSPILLLEFGTGVN